MYHVSSFNCFITVLTPLYADPLIGRLVKEGYIISPFNQLIISYGASSIIAFQCDSQKDISLNDFSDLLNHIFNELKIKVYSKVIVNSYGISYSPANFELPNKPVKNIPPLEKNGNIINFPSKDDNESKD